MRGSAEVALQANPEPTARDALVECLEESERVLRMLNTLLDISEAEAGMMKLTCAQVDLERLLLDVVELYRYVAEDKQIRLEMDVLPGTQVKADAMRLSQVLANLLDNAIKYTPTGGCVALKAGSDSNGPFVRIRDTGQGIPEAEQGKIWDRLYRGDKSRSQRGLGLGLSLVKAVVEAHGGAVHVESREGQGATFTVRLPKV
jgi:signal transduction histidine kinase